MTDDEQPVPVSDPVSESARAAAHRLAAQLGPGVAADVEAALHQRGHTQRQEQYLDPISLGVLIVSVATLAWTVYTDLKQKTPKPAAEVLARTVRVQLRSIDATPPEQRDRIIEVVVSETLRVAGDRADAAIDEQSVDL